VTLTLDRNGLRRLFDETYAADKEEVPKRQLWKNKDKENRPARPHGGGRGRRRQGQVKKEKLSFYEVVVRSRHPG